MGANQSKTMKRGGAKDGKCSPNQEKHTSANSTTPLAVKAAELDINRSPTLNKHTSFSEKSLSRSRTNTLSFHGSTLASIDIEPLPPKVHELDGHSDVSRPPPPPRLRHLSELIDPAELPVDGHIRSPSGHLLAPEQFLVHPNRPLSIRERQEEIRERVRAASRLGVEAENADEVPGVQPKKRCAGWCCLG